MREEPGSQTEKDKIKGAIRTDFILSAEIIVIALGTVAQEPLVTRFAVLAAVAIAMTVARSRSSSPGRNPKMAARRVDASSASVS